MLGEEHPDTINSLEDIATTYIDLNKYWKGIKIHEKVYKLKCKVLGKNHPHIKDTLKMLALECLIGYKLFKAVYYFVKCLLIKNPLS